MEYLCDTMRPNAIDVWLTMLCSKAAAGLRKIIAWSLRGLSAGDFKNYAPLPTAADKTGKHLFRSGACFGSPLTPLFLSLFLIRSLRRKKRANNKQIQVHGLGGRRMDKNNCPRVHGRSNRRPANGLEREVFAGRNSGEPLGQNTAPAYLWLRKFLLLRLASLSPSVRRGPTYKRDRCIFVYPPTGPQGQTCHKRAAAPRFNAIGNR